jgi:hypothetical protein
MKLAYTSCHLKKIKGEKTTWCGSCVVEDPTLEHVQMVYYHQNDMLRTPLICNFNIFPMGMYKSLQYGE